MLETKYEALRRTSSDTNDSEANEALRGYGPSRQSSRWTPTLVILLVLSFAANAVLLFLLPGKLSTHVLEGYTIPQERNITVVIPHDERTLYDEVWDDPRYNYNTGMIAMDADFVKKYNLPKAQKWPWDQSKGIYYLQAWHSMHCISLLREALIDIDQKRSLSLSMSHLTHCLHSLREDTVCHADDTPLYTGAFNAESGRPRTAPGHGQTRVCRNWDLVRQFAVEHSACFDLTAAGYAPEVEKYKYCPDDRRPWEQKESVS